MKISTSLQKNKRLTVETYESQNNVSGCWPHKGIDIYHSRKLVPPLYEALLGLCVFLTCKQHPVSKYFTKPKLFFLENERVYIPLEVSSSLAKSEDGEKRAMSIVVCLLLRKQTLRNSELLCLLCNFRKEWNSKPNTGKGNYTRAHKAHQKKRDHVQWTKQGPAHSV